MVTKYQKRISGPLLDRIDIHIEVPRVDYEKLSGDRLGDAIKAVANLGKGGSIFIRYHEDWYGPRSRVYIKLYGFVLIQ
jgi:magnesium chelatase family protein